jgi:hypothetical protein
LIGPTPLRLERTGTPARFYGTPIDDADVGRIVRARRAPAAGSLMPPRPRLKNDRETDKLLKSAAISSISGNNAAIVCPTINAVTSVSLRVRT